MLARIFLQSLKLLFFAAVLFRSVTGTPVSQLFPTYLQIYLPIKKFYLPICLKKKLELSVAPLREYGSRILIGHNKITWLVHKG